MTDLFGKMHRKEYNELSVEQKKERQRFQKKEANKKYYEKNPEKIKEANKRYREKNPEKVNEYSRKYYKKKQLNKIKN